MIAFVEDKLCLLKETLKFSLMRYYDPDFRLWLTQYARRLRKFKNTHRGEDCFIIGNGPSLNKMDLAPLNNHYIFGLNKIYLIFAQVKLNLSFYVAVNPYVIQQSVNEIEALGCPCFIAFNSQGLRTPIQNLEHIYFFMTHGRIGSFQGDLMQPLWGGATVTYAAIQIAYYMRFSRIFLIGVDHNYKAQGKPSQTQILEGKDTNHFSGRYFTGQQWQLPNLPLAETAFRIADHHFQKNGCQIYDATVDGKLNVFPKISFAQALATCSKKSR